MSDMPTAGEVRTALDTIRRFIDGVQALVDPLAKATGTAAKTVVVKRTPEKPEAEDAPETGGPELEEPPTSKERVLATLEVADKPMMSKGILRDHKARKWASAEKEGALDSIRSSLAYLKKNGIIEFLPDQGYRMIRKEATA